MFYLAMCPRALFCGLLHKHFLCNIFFFTITIDFASYTDQNTLFTCGKSILKEVSKTENKTKKHFKQFTDYQMKATFDKCYLINNQNEQSGIERSILKNCKKQEI